MSLIAIKRNDGGVSVTWLPDGADPATEVAKWEAGSSYSAVSWRTIVEADVPADKTFRDAWADTGTVIAVDMPKARTIHMDRIRVVRDRELEKLDVRYYRADEAGDLTKKKSIADEKQALRDIPQTFDLTGATTPAELDALWPAELPRA